MDRGDRRSSGSGAARAGAGPRGARAAGRASGSNAVREELLGAGLSVHAVGPINHDFGAAGYDPLTHLEFSEAEWKVRPDQFHLNQHPAAEYPALFTEGGFEVLRFETRPKPYRRYELGRRLKYVDYVATPQRVQKLHARFHKYSPEELSATYVLIVAKKR